MNQLGWDLPQSLSDLLIVRFLRGVGLLAIRVVGSSLKLIKILQSAIESGLSSAQRALCEEAEDRVDQIEEQALEKASVEEIPVKVRK